MKALGLIFALFLFDVPSIYSPLFLVMYSNVLFISCLYNFWVCFWNCASVCSHILPLASGSGSVVFLACLRMYKRLFGFIAVIWYGVSITVFFLALFSLLGSHCEALVWPYLNAPEYRARYVCLKIGRYTVYLEIWRLLYLTPYWSSYIWFTSEYFS